MKKMLFTVSILLCLLLLIACQDNHADNDSATQDMFPTTDMPILPDAASAWEAIDSTMNALSSYRAEIVMETTFLSSGHAVESKATGTIIEIMNEPDDYYFYTAAKTTVISKSLSLNQTTETIEAYHDGMVFLSTKSNKLKQKLCAPMTAADYAVYREKDTSITQWDITDCNKSDVVRDETNAITLTFSGYTKKAVNAFMDTLSFTPEILGSDIVERVVTITADDQNRVTLMTIHPLFEEVAEDITPPTMHFRYTISEFNEAKPITGTIREKDYVRIADIRLLDEVETLLAARQNATKGTFSYQWDEKLLVVGNGDSYSETGTAEYEEVNGQYSFFITTTSDGTDTDYSYAGGSFNQMVPISDYHYSQAMTDAEARAYLANRINLANFDRTYVTNIEKLGNDVYKIEVKSVNPSIYEPIYQDMEVTYRDGSQTILMTVENGMLVKIESTVETNGYIESGFNSYGVGLDITSVVTFRDDGQSQV